MVIMVRATAAPHHHVVHPVVCCTVKRVMRLLPSALLLIFVLSLILVTLVQIAVIHSHRRAIYLQRRLASTSRPSPARPQGRGSLPGTAAACGLVPRKAARPGLRRLTSRPGRPSTGPGAGTIRTASPTLVTIGPKRRSGRDLTRYRSRPCWTATRPPWTTTSKS
ncbi:hypothetical protein MRX96_055269 [Rhipicephalus microplus]